MKDIVILGAAYFAREVYSMVMDCIADGAPWRFKGFVDDRKQLLDDFPHEGEMLGGVESYTPNSNDCVIPALGDPKIRERYVTDMINKGGHFGTLIHPSALVGRNVQIGQGCVITQLAILTADLRLADFVNIGVRSTLSHGNEIGDWVTLAGHCNVAGEVKIGKRSFLGCNVSVVPHVTIGEGAYVGVGSVVTHNVRPGKKVFGNPARIVGLADDVLS